MVKGTTRLKKKTRRISFDFEFVEGNPCLPISIGMVDIDTEEGIYLEWENAGVLALSSPWLAANVYPHLNRWARFDSAEIRKKIVEFLGDGAIELYACCGAYDFFLLSQALGGFQQSPGNFPYTYRDTYLMNLPKIAQIGNEHNALDDARTEALRVKMGESITVS